MDERKEKDALTDLVGDVSSQPSASNQSSNNGTVSTPSGDRVNLGFGAQLVDLARRLDRSVKRKKAEEKAVMEQFVKKDKNSDKNSVDPS